MVRIVTIFLILAISVLMVSCEPGIDERLHKETKESTNSSSQWLNTESIMDTTAETPSIDVSETEVTAETDDLQNGLDEESGFGEFVDVTRP